MDKSGIYKRAQDCLGQGCLTNSKHPDSFVFGVYPTHLSSEPGRGCHLFSYEGKAYIDYICGLGTNLLGYGYSPIADDIRKAPIGSPSLSTIYEIEAAESLKTMFYFTSKWKFVSTGTEACMAAIKMARAYTGRKVVLSQGYHGWSDEFVSLTPPASGVHTCRDIYDLDIYLNGAEDLKQVAAIIVEPVITDDSDARIDYLKRLRDICDKNDIVLIFDEIITSYRYRKHCVSLAFNILPDLLIVGKAMSFGIPKAAVGGKRKILDGSYFVSGTFSGEILGLRAAKLVTDHMVNRNHHSIDRLFDHGLEFVKKFNEMAAPFIKITGYGTRGVFEGDPTNKALFCQEAVKAGFLFHPGTWFYNFPLMEEDYVFFQFLKGWTQTMRLKGFKLEGQIPKSPFAQKLREGK